MMTTTNLKALAKAVKANPADAALRLVYADALQEAGQSDYLQREMANYLQAPGSEVFGNYVATRETSPTGKPLARLIRLSTGKQIHFYNFRNAEQRDQWIATTRAQEEASNTAKANREAAKRAARENFVNPYKVGDVLHKTWGYDQTNVDFAEVVEVGERSVVLRELAQNRTSTHWLAGQTVPSKGHYIGEPFRVTVQLSVYSDGQVHYYLPAKYGSWSNWHGSPVGYSEYA